MKIAIYLAKLGHKRAAFIPSDGAADYPAHKWLPYQRCFKKAGIDLIADEIWQTDSFAKHPGHVTAKVARALLEVEEGVTALLLQNDTVAAGVISEVRNMGLKVPSDISVVGFDDLEFAKYFQPAITTVRGPEPEQVGQAAFNMLSSLINNPGIEVEKQIFPFELIERQSTGPAPKRAAYITSADVGQGSCIDPPHG